MTETPTRAPDPVPPKRRPAPPVQAAQRQLHQQGYNPGPIDGIMGGYTRTALRQFQQKQGLAVTGRLDTKTKARLFNPKAERPLGEAPPSRKTSVPPGNDPAGEQEPELLPSFSDVPVY